MNESLARSMNATTVGSGEETLILAHGFGSDQSIWDDVVPLLERRYTLVLFDWCFAGTVSDRSLYDPVRYSSYEAFADDLISLVEEMNLKSSILVGHSVSGMIACVAAVKRPELFRSLVLIATTPRLLNTQGYEGGFELSQVESIFSSIATKFEEWASEFAAIVVDGPGSRATDKFIASIKNMRSQDVALPLAKTIFLGDYRDILPKVVTPCHLINNRKDIVVPTSVVEYMQSKIMAKCDVTIIEAEGHFPQLTSPEKLAHIIQAILA